MSDMLVELGANPTARKLIAALGLPLPLPQRLRRGRGPWRAQPLADGAAVVDVGAGGALGAVLAATLAPAGLAVTVVGDDDVRRGFEVQGEAWGRPVAAAARDAGERADALIFDATGVRGVDELRALYAFFHPRVRELARCGRVVVLGRPAAACATVGEAAAAAALDGFVRSLAKEIGRRGATANRVVVDAGAEGNLPAVLRYVLSERAAYVTGQTVHVSATAGVAGDAPLVRPLAGKVALVTGAARGIGADTGPDSLIRGQSVGG